MHILPSPLEPAGAALLPSARRGRSRGRRRRPACRGREQLCPRVALGSSGHARSLRFETLAACFRESTARFPGLPLLSSLLLLSTHERLRAEALDWTSPQNSTPMYPAATWLPCSRPNYNTPRWQSWSSRMFFTHIFLLFRYSDSIFLLAQAKTLVIDLDSLMSYFTSNFFLSVLSSGFM